MWEEWYARWARRALTCSLERTIQHTRLPHHMHLAIDRVADEGRRCAGIRAEDALRHEEGANYDFPTTVQSCMMWMPVAACMVRLLYASHLFHV